MLVTTFSLISTGPKIRSISSLWNWESTGGLCYKKYGGNNFKMELLDLVNNFQIKVTDFFLIWQKVINYFKRTIIKYWTITLTFCSNIYSCFERSLWSNTFRWLLSERFLPEKVLVLKVRWHVSYHISSDKRRA